MKYKGVFNIKESLVNSVDIFRHNNVRFILYTLFSWFYDIVYIVMFYLWKMPLCFVMTTWLFTDISYAVCWNIFLPIFVVLLPYSLYIIYKPMQSHKICLVNSVKWPFNPDLYIAGVELKSSWYVKGLDRVECIVIHQNNQLCL